VAGNSNGSAPRLADAPNFRDFGGYGTSDGRRVRTGVLYRSDQLHRLAGRDLQSIGELGISLVIDLRQAPERRRAPNPPIGGARELVADVLAGAGRDAEGITADGWARIAAGLGTEFMRELYRDLVASAGARRAYAAMMRGIIEAEGAVVIHCAAGQDRTGWAVATLLTALGVHRDVVIEDYLLSAARLDEKHQRVAKSYARRYAHLGIGESELQPLLWIRREYIEEAFAEMERLYGSFEDYLQQALGVDAGARDALRARLLVNDGPHR
jgi:protein-tyrosine phosphatase